MIPAPEPRAFSQSAPRVGRMSGAFAVSVQRGRPLVLAEQRLADRRVLARPVELEPHVARAVVHAPPPRDVRHDEQAEPADVLRTVLAHLRLESAAVVDDLAADLVVVDVEAQTNGTVA